MWNAGRPASVRGRGAAVTFLLKHGAKVFDCAHGCGAEASARRSQIDKSTDAVQAMAEVATAWLEGLPGSGGRWSECRVESRWVKKSGQSSGKRRCGWCVAPLLGDLRRRVAAPGFAQLETANGKWERGLVWAATPACGPSNARAVWWAPRAARASRGQICDGLREGETTKGRQKDAVARRSWCDLPPYKNAPSVSQITGNNSGLAQVQGAGLRSPHKRFRQLVRRDL